MSEDILERAKAERKARESGAMWSEDTESLYDELIAEVEAKDKQIKELQDIIDKPPEEAQWMTDYHLLQSALDGPIIESARRWHGAFRKAQNSNLIRLQQNERLEAKVERLRSIQASNAVRYIVLTDWFRTTGKDLPIATEFWNIMANGKPRPTDNPTYAQILAVKDTRIKELEEMIKQLGRLAFMHDVPLEQIIAHFVAWGKSNYDYTSRLEAAFLDSLAARLYYEHYPGVSDAYSWHDYPEEACHSMPKEEFRKKAREALEIIKEGGKDE